MKIFLIGLPGSGKSTLGKKLARSLKVPFVDLDTVIETAAGQPIRTIFAEQGEEAFRKQEQKALHQIIEQQASFVLATGGGTPCFYNNMQVMDQVGITLYLDIPMAVIVQRMQGAQVTNRPLLQGMDTKALEEEFKAKFAHRIPVYQQAQYTLCHPIDVAHTVQLIQGIKS